MGHFQEQPDKCRYNARLKSREDIKQACQKNANLVPRAFPRLREKDWGVRGGGVGS